MAHIELEDTYKPPETEPLKQLNQQFHEQLGATMRQQVDERLWQRTSNSGESLESVDAARAVGCHANGQCNNR